jgi:hypothetical protein
MTRYFPFPLTATALLLVGGLTLGLLVAVKAGIAGILLAAVLVAWFFCYCYLVLDAIVAGAASPPGLSFEILNPLAERRPIAQAILLAIGAALVVATIKFLGFIAGAVCCGLLLVWLPASIAILATTRHPLQAIWPPQLIGFARSCGGHYTQTMMVFVALGSLLFGLLRFAAPLWMVSSAAQLMLLVGFALVAGAMLEHSHELGIAPEQHAQREADRAARLLALQRRRMLERAYLKLKVGNPMESWQEIQAWLGQHGRGDRALVERRAILEIAGAWDDPRPADRIADEVIGLHLARRESGRAMEILERRLAANPRFRPGSAHRPRLAELATLAGKPALRRHLDAFNTMTQTVPSRATRW